MKNYGNSWLTVIRKKAAELFETGMLDTLEAGKTASLQAIRKNLFDVICFFAGEIRKKYFKRQFFNLHP